MCTSWATKRPTNCRPTCSTSVCIKPQVVNAVTHGNYLLKIDEYLVTGRPVVPTRIRIMELFADYTYLAANPF
jgi:teichuronic acid biosynthesis glycosyltransferase TuaH